MTDTAWMHARATALEDSVFRLRVIVTVLTAFVAVQGVMQWRLADVAARQAGAQVRFMESSNATAAAHTQAIAELREDTGQPNACWEVGP